MKSRLIKGFAALAAAFVCTCSSVFAATYNIEDLGMSVDIPDTMVTVDLQMDDSHPIIEKLQSSKQMIINTMNRQNVYLMAVTDDLADSVTISMTQNRKSKEIYDLNRFPKPAIQKTIDQLLQDMTDIRSYTIDSNEQVWFVRCERQQEQGDFMQYGLSYFTIVNGQLITINWGSENEPLTDEEVAQLDDIMKSIHFREISLGWHINYNYLIVGMMFGTGILILIVLIKILINRGRNKRKKSRYTWD